MTTERKPLTEAEVKTMLARFSNPSRHAILLFSVLYLPRLVDADMRLRALLGVPYS